MESASASSSNSTDDMSVMSNSAGTTPAKTTSKVSPPGQALTGTSPPSEQAGNASGSLVRDDQRFTSKWTELLAADNTQELACELGGLVAALRNVPEAGMWHEKCQLNDLGQCINGNHPVDMSDEAAAYEVANILEDMIACQKYPRSLYSRMVHDEHFAHESDAYFVPIATSEDKDAQMFASRIYEDFTHCGRVFGQDKHGNALSPYFVVSTRIDVDLILAQLLNGGVTGFIKLVQDIPSFKVMCKTEDEQFFHTAFAFADVRECKALKDWFDVLANLADVRFGRILTSCLTAMDFQTRFPFSSKRLKRLKRLKGRGYPEHIFYQDLTKYVDNFGGQILFEVLYMGDSNGQTWQHIQDTARAHAEDFLENFLNDPHAIKVMTIIPNQPQKDVVMFHIELNVHERAKDVCRVIQAQHMGFARGQYSLYAVPFDYGILVRPNQITYPPLEFLEIDSNNYTIAFAQRWWYGYQTNWPSPFLSGGGNGGNDNDGDGGDNHGGDGHGGSSVSHFSDSTENQNTRGSGRESSSNWGGGDPTRYVASGSGPMSDSIGSSSSSASAYSSRRYNTPGKHRLTNSLLPLPNSGPPIGAANNSSIPPSPGHPMVHKNVVRMEAVVAGIDVRSTLMLRNIPNRFDHDLLKYLLDLAGCAGTYDFLYLRVDFGSGSNVGYAFINFVSVGYIPKFLRAFAGAKWPHSEKVAEVSYATMQGRETLIQKFRNSNVMQENPEYRPKLYYAVPHPLSGLEEPFPGPDNAFKLLRSQQNATTMGLFSPRRGGYRYQGTPRQRRY